MAEAILNHDLGGQVRAHVGRNPPQPQVAEGAFGRCNSPGSPLKGSIPRTVDAVCNEAIDLVVTVCDNAKESLPRFPRPLPRIHLPFHDPHGETLESFIRVRDEIRARLIPAVKARLASGMSSLARRKVTAEALGTAFLLAVVVGSGIMGERLAGGNVAAGPARQHPGHGRRPGGVDPRLRACFRRPLQPGGDPGGRLAGRPALARGAGLSAAHRCWALMPAWRRPISCSTSRCSSPRCMSAAARRNSGSASSSPPSACSR